jgi:hypothetical protein
VLAIVLAIALSRDGVLKHQNALIPVSSRPITS